MLIKRISQGDMIPRFYGVAWRDYYRNQAVCLPIGLNLIAALVRMVYHRIQYPGDIVVSDPHDAYHQGYKAGRASVPVSRDRGESMAP